MRYMRTTLLAELNPCDYSSYQLPPKSAFVIIRNSSSRNFKKARTIRRIRKNLEAGQSWRMAQINAGIKSSYTVYNWSKKHPRLKPYFEAARIRGEQARHQIVEDGLFRKLRTGDAGAREYEFYLCNRVPERWKKQTEFLAAPPSDGGVQRLPQRPVINYIAVHAENAKIEVSGNGGNGKGHDNGGNGHRIEEHA